MTKVRTSDGKLVIDVEGWDKLWAFKSRLEIPLNHISGVRSGADERASGIRAPGTHIPGVITAGTFHQIGKRCSGMFITQSEPSPLIYTTIATAHWSLRWQTQKLRYARFREVSHP